MTEDFNDIFGDLKRESMTPLEKSRMRNELALFVSEHPATAPLHVRLLDRIEAWTAVRSGSIYARGLSAALALVLVVGIGTSYAAEDALPGDALYGVKLNVNEAFLGALAVSQSARAQWNATQVSRRLEEAEKLASENKLTPIARAQIEMQLSDTAKDFDTNVAALEKSDDTAAVATAQTDLQASLDAHESVLASLSADTAAGTSLAPIISTVRAQAIALASAQQHVVATLAAATPSVAKAAAIKQKADASAAIGRVHAAIAAQPTTDVGDADAGATIADSAVDAGDQKLSEGKYSEAFAAFQTATRVAKTAEVHLDAAASLGIASSSATSTATSTSATSTATTTAQDASSTDAH